MLMEMERDIPREISDHLYLMWSRLREGKGGQWVYTLLEKLKEGIISPDLITFLNEMLTAIRNGESNLYTAVPFPYERQQSNADYTNLKIHDLELWLSFLEKERGEVEE